MINQPEREGNDATGFRELNGITGREVKSVAVRGAGFAFGSQWIRQVIGLGGTVVLARLLTPSDFGLVAMVTAVTGMLEMYKDLGLSAATVQAPRLDEDHVNGLFWINTGLTVLIVAVLMAMAPALAKFYGRSEIVAVMWALAAGFLAAGLSIQHWALMRRAMRFGTLAAIETTGMALAAGLAVVAALAGLAYWALVVFIVTPRFVNMCGVWLCCAWRPRVTFRGAGLRPLCSFGAKVAACNGLTAFAAGMDSVLIGRMAGGYPLGLYNRALQVRAVFSGLMDIPLTSIAGAALSRLQSDPTLFCMAYQRILYVFQSALVPFWLVTFLCPEALLSIVFGGQWVASASLVRILGLLLLVQPLQTLINTALVSRGRSGMMLLSGGISSGVLLVCFGAGMMWGGVKGVALGYVAAATVSCVAGLLIGARALECGGPWSLLRPVLIPLTAGGASAAGGFLIWRLICESPGGGQGVAPELWMTLIACCLYGVIMLLDLRRQNFLGLSWELLISSAGKRKLFPSDAHG